MPKIEIPKAQSENFYSLYPQKSAQYNDYPFLSVLWQESLKYWQKYNKFKDNNNPQYFRLKRFNQRVSIQLGIPYIPFGLNYTATMSYLQCGGTLTPVGGTYAEFYMGPNDVNSDGVTLKHSQWDFLIGDVISTAGKYAFYCKIEFTNGDIEELISEPMWIKENHENAVLLEWRHSVNDYDVLWSMNPAFNMLLNGNIDYAFDKLERTTFRNQRANERQLYARNWSVFDLTFGFPTFGISNYDQNKLYNIFKCDETYIEGTRYLMETEAEFEAELISQAWPLKNVKTQVVMYDQSDSTEAGGAGTFMVMNLGEIDGYPYLVDNFKFTGVGSAGVPYPDFLQFYASSNYLAMIMDSSEQAAFLAQLDADAIAFGMIGVFDVVADILYYKRGIGETYAIDSVTKMSNCLEIEYTTVPTHAVMTLEVFAVNKTAVAVVRATGGVKIDPTLNIGDFTQGYDTATDYDDYVCLVFTDDTMTTINISNTGNIITGFGGEVSNILQRFSTIGGAMPIFTITHLLRAELTLQYLFATNMGIIDVDNTDFTVPLGSGKWQNLKYWFLYQNEMTGASQDNFYVDIFTIASVYTFTWASGQLNTQLQSPPSTPSTLGSGAERSAMGVYGITIAF